MLDRRSFLVGAFSSAWVVGASAFAAEEGAVDKKDRIPFAPALARHGGGGIINIASVFGMTGAAHTSAYSISKAGIAGMTLQLALAAGDVDV